MKKRIQMLKSTLGSERGNVTELFTKGIIYHVTPSLSEVFVEEMGVARYTTSAMKRTPIPIPDETPELPRTLKDPPRTWTGFIVRHKDSGTDRSGAVAKIIKTLARGEILLSSGEIVSYRTIRKDWEIVNGD